METTSKSTELLARLRSVTLEDELKLTDFWPSENSSAETSVGSSFKRDLLSSYKPSWEDTDLPLRSAASSDSDSKSQSEQTRLEPVVKDFSDSPLSTSETSQKRENPFARMSRKGSKLTSKLSKKLHSWMMNTSCFGLLGLVCGGSLTAWSLLAKSGSHSMSALGLSLAITGLLMLVCAGICQTVLRTSGQT